MLTSSMLGEVKKVSEESKIQHVKHAQSNQTWLFLAWNRIFSCHTVAIIHSLLKLYVENYVFLTLFIVQSNKTLLLARLQSAQA